MVQIGEFKSVRTATNNLEAIASGKQHNDGADQCAGSGRPEAATRGTTSLAGNARAVPKAVTPYELAEERLGAAMLREALECYRMPNPENDAVMSSMAREVREQRVAHRRSEVVRHSRENKLTLYQVAVALNAAVSTIRTDMRVLRVKFKAATSPQHDRAGIRREKLEVLSHMGITRAEAARRLDVSEATIRRDLKLSGIKWGES